MQIKTLSDQNLDTQLKKLVTFEREILSEILLHIVEVEKRKLYLTFGFGSLFEYLTKSIGYSHGSAQRRIDAARLSFEVPEVIESLQSGNINLAQISCLQKMAREAQAKNKTKVSPKIKAALLEQFTHKSYAETQILISKCLDIPPKEETKITSQQDESVRLEVTLTKSQWQKLSRMRELLSNSLPNGSEWAEVFEHVSDLVIQKRDKTLSKARPQSSVNSKVHDQTNIITQTNSTSKPHTKPLQNRVSIPLSLQNEIYQRDRCCQYVDKNSGRKCESRWKLQIDHIQPLWAGGNNTIDNLRILCANHNRELYKWQTRVRSL